LEEAAADAGLDATTSSEVVDDLGAIVPGIVTPLLQGIVSIVPTVASIGASLLLSFVAGFFFLKDGHQMWRWITSRIGGTLGGGGLVDEIGRRVWAELSGFIRGQTIIAVIDATGILVGALVLGVPEPAAIFMLTLLGAYIPYIGAFLSGLVAVMLALGDSGIPAGVAMLAIVVAVQLVEGNVLQPWIQGKSVRLHPLVIALSVPAGGAIAGFLGVLLAVPVTAAAVVTLSELRRAGVIGEALPAAQAAEAAEAAGVSVTP
jgi:predicted PurR-regulated permease PerM